MTDNKKKKVIAIISSIIIVIILILAIAYAFFSTQLNGSSNIVKVGELELILNETSEGISLDNAVGLSDSDGMSLTSSTFELKNNGDNAVDYTIYLDDNTIGETDIRIDDKYLKYNLNKNGTDSGATLLTRIGSNPNRVLDSGTIEGNGTNTYSLNIWITDEVDGNYSGQVFSGKLRVEVSQEKAKEVFTVLLDSIPKENQYDDGENTFITGENPNNYIWYSGKLWRAVSVNNETKTTKLVTQWNISAIPYNTSGSTAFQDSHIHMWLNDTSVDGFLGNLRSPEDFIEMDSVWNATMMNDTSKPPKESQGGTTVISSVGLLNIYEYTISYRDTTVSNGYLNNGLMWWFLTPYNNEMNYYANNNGVLGTYSPAGAYGIRPSVNLKTNVKIVSGNGTSDNPYRLLGDNDTNLSSVKLNTRYSGEYVRFGNNENNLYRIVSHENGQGTKITSATPLKENGEVKNLLFGDSIIFSSNSSIGNFLNNDYLNPSNGYLSTDELNMIEDNTVFYLGTVGYGMNYKLAKYTNTTDNLLISNVVTVNIGLLRLGELMAGQFNSGNKSSSYWTITPYNTELVRNINRNSNISSSNLSTTAGIKPVLNLKQNVIITSGEGTEENPFTITLSE